MSFDAYTPFGQNLFQPLRVISPRDPAQNIDIADPNGGEYIIDQEWFNSVAKTFWKYAGAGLWIKLSSGGVGPLLMFDVPLGTSPIMPDINGNVTFTSNAGTIAITGSTGGNPNFINFDLTGGSLGIDSIGVQDPLGGTVLPDGTGKVNFQGRNVAAHLTPVEITSTVANTVNVDVQTTSETAISDDDLNGLCHFNNAQFDVDANGFVTLSGSTGPAATKFGTQTGTNPVVPTAAGLVTINGATVAAGTNPVRSDGTGANTLAIEVQRSQALAAADSSKVGLSNYSSAQFDVDADGFVTLSGSVGPATTKLDIDAHTAPGTDPVVPSAAGVIILTGAQVAAGTVGTNVIRTDSLAANTCTIEIQRSTTSATTDLTKNGVCHFNSSQFTVDTNGFVSSTTGGGSGTVVQEVRTSSTVSVSTTKTLTVTTAPTTANTDSIISLAITPTNAANIIYVEFNTVWSPTASTSLNTSFCIFSGSTFLTAVAQWQNDVTPTNFAHSYFFTAGSTSTVTIDIRWAGTAAGTYRTLQNGAGTALYGAAGNTATTLTITEVTP